MKGMTQAFSHAHQATSHVHEAVSGMNGRMIGANALSRVGSARRKGKGVRSLKLKLAELLVLMAMESKLNNASNANVQVLNIDYVKYIFELIFLIYIRLQLRKIDNNTCIYLKLIANGKTGEILFIHFLESSGLRVQENVEKEQKFKHGK